MAEKERYQNPVVDDDIKLRLFTYNSNSKTSVQAVDKVEIYHLDPTEVSDANPYGKRLVETITSITNEDTGQYLIETNLESPKYVIGRYLDVWYVQYSENDIVATVENHWQIFPNLWHTTPIPVVYDFKFTFSPNKIRQGSKKWLIIDITPSVPRATDLNRYYENLAIVNPLKISIDMNCGDCVPTEQDLRSIVEEADIDYREKCKGYYLLDTNDMDCGIYDVWLKMEFGDTIHISDKLPLQIY